MRKSCPAYFAYLAAHLFKSDRYQRAVTPPQRSTASSAKPFRPVYVFSSILRFVRMKATHLHLSLSAHCKNPFVSLNSIDPASLLQLKDNVGMFIEPIKQSISYGQFPKSHHFSFTCHQPFIIQVEFSRCFIQKFI